MKDRQQTIMELLDGYETIVKKAKDAGFITTKNFLGDIVETLVCSKINADKCNASQKGFDALRNKERIQIKFRSRNKKDKYKITFKNVTETEIGFDTLAFCCQNDEGYDIYEIKVEDFPDTQFKEEKKHRVLFLDDIFLKKNKIKKHQIKGANKT
tara:strand:+ start:316 stop:780 length:465 start_codon:yes stop_codon:yes gene_type:complete